MRHFKTVHFFNEATKTTDCETKTVNFEATTKTNETTCHKCATTKAFQDRVFAAHK